MRLSPESAVRLIRECFPLIPPPPMPPPTSPTSNSSTPTLTPNPNPPPPKVGMASTVQLSTFKGIVNEELVWFWFVIKYVWDAQSITDDSINKATLVSVLQDCALTWYMKYSSDHPNEGLVVIQEALNKEFGQPKSEAQSDIGFKEIVILPSGNPWDLDQRLKSIIHEANMTLTNEKHRTWFTASLTPYLRSTLSQQKISTQAEALDAAMRLRKTLIHDPGLGVQQIQVKIQNLCMEM